MKLLLDTHTLLWWLADDRRLGPQARQLIADPANDVLVSVVSLWEIVVNVRAGKLTADITAIIDSILPGGFDLIDLRTAHLLTLSGLPMHHRDPFDHLLVAQAIAEGASFISDDRNVSRYQLQLVPCADATPASRTE